MCHEFMKCNVPGFLASLVKNLPKQTDRRLLPLITIDENLNSKKLWAALRPLVATGKVDGLLPLWYEQRESVTAEKAYSIGSLSKWAEPWLGLSSRKGWSWDDQSVICNLVAQFGSHDRLVCLTGDCGGDPRGIAALLKNVVAPSLSIYHGGRLGLLVVGKHGRTPLPTYVVAVARHIVANCVDLGYSEVWL